MNHYLTVFLIFLFCTSFVSLPITEAKLLNLPSGFGLPPSSTAQNGDADIDIYARQLLTPPDRSNRLNRLIQHKLVRAILISLTAKVILNVCFRHEKEIAGIEAARSIIAASGSTVKPLVFSFNDALLLQREWRKREGYRQRLDAYDNAYHYLKHPRSNLPKGYMIITGVPSSGAFNGGLDQAAFPFAQPLFPNMCRPMTSWQSFTVGQTIYPEALGSRNFCKGTLIWFIDNDGQPSFAKTDALDRKHVFHTALWLKHIFGLPKIQWLKRLQIPLWLAFQSLLFYRVPTSALKAVLPVMLIAGGLSSSVYEKTLKRFTTTYPKNTTNEGVKYY